ncbi:NAD(P)-dependent oxidoreductase [Mycobacterium eburneum]|nr:NAD(P)-dependent oxidoreductase [Mycobacterium eburneum]TDH46217.1 NAD(P)-dependent oxidoreductase [Mycobacterium eburneum]
MGDVIGFIGAGQLGEPMVRRLVAAGHRVQAYARRGEVRERLASAGAAVSDSIAAVAAAGDVLISCLFSDAQLLDVGSGPDGIAANARPGCVFVSHTTGTTATLRMLEKWSTGALRICDAPVSGTAHDIERGELTVLLGGRDEAVERARPVLGAYASVVMATGELGSALAVKLINNVLFAANAQLVAAAVESGGSLGVQPEVLLDALAVCSGGSAAAAHVRRLGGPRRFADAVSAFLAKDIDAARAAADAVGVDLGLLERTATDGPLALRVPFGG